MPRLRIFSCLLVLALLVLIHAPSALAERLRLDFNQDWRLLVGDPHGAEQPGFDDGPWQRVTTPHAWNEDSAYRASPCRMPKATRSPGALATATTTLPVDVVETHALIEVDGHIDQAQPKSESTAQTGTAAQPKDAAQPEGKRAKPVLGILEADIFEPAP